MNSLVINISLWQGHLTLTGTFCSSPAKGQKREETVPVRALHPAAFLYWDSPALIDNFHMHLWVPSAFLPCRSWWWWLGVNHFTQDNICPPWQEKLTLRVGKVIPEGLQVFVAATSIHASPSDKGMLIVPQHKWEQRVLSCALPLAIGHWETCVLEQWQELPVIPPPICAADCQLHKSHLKFRASCWALLLTLVRVLCCNGQEHFPLDDR